jgi:hypothetical protein
MAIYPSDEQSTGLDQLSEVASNDLIIIGDVSDADRSLKTIAVEDFSTSFFELNKATPDDVDDGTDDTKVVTPYSIANSHNVPNVVPGPIGNVMTSDGTDWISSPPASSGGGGGGGTGTGASKDFTAGENLNENDYVYPSANDTVLRYRPKGFSGTINVTTDPTTAWGASTALKSFKISATQVLFFGGGGKSVNLAGKYGIATISASGDITAVSSATYTADTVNYFDVCQIDIDKYFIIWQNNNAGANGIKCRILSVSGGLGGTSTIETTGDPGAMVSCVALDSTRILISSMRDSDTTFVTRVISISGTTISAINSAVQVDSTVSANQRNAMCLLDTDKVFLLYHSGSANGLNSRVITISGTTPTLNSIFAVNATAGSDYNIGVVKLATDQVFMAYECGGGGGPNATYRAATVSSTTITLGTATVVSAFAQAWKDFLSFNLQDFRFIGSSRISYCNWFCNILL